MSDSIIERLRHHAQDERNTAFARSTMREAELEIEQQRLSEEGAKEAFAHVVQQKRDLETERKRLGGLLHDAYKIIRQKELELSASREREARMLALLQAADVLFAHHCQDCTAWNWLDNTRAELAASRDELEGAKKSANAQARLIASLEQQRMHLHAQRDQWIEARNTLDSERAANARLTEELAACREREARMREALWQLLDDMGESGLCVCAAAKEQARAALAEGAQG